MGDPDFRSDEKVLLRTGGVSIKSVPFEATLTDRRIVLVDRVKNAIPQRDILLSSIRQIAPGENAIRDPTLTVYVAGEGSETRQMILTFSREAGGNRTKERDEWLRFLEYYIPRAQPPAPPRSAGIPVPRQEDVVIPPKKMVIENAPAAVPPREAPAPAPAAPEVFFCNRCGNRVTAEYAFCNKCGAPIVPPAPAPHAAAGVSPAAPATYRAPATPPQDEQPPLDSVRVAPPEPAPVRPPVRPPSDTRTQTVPAPRKSAEPARKAPKQGFIPRLFSPKARSAEKRSDRAAAPLPPPEKPRKSRSPGSGRKIALIAIVIVVILAVVGIGAFVVYPMISSGGFPSLSLGGSPGEGGSSSSGTVTVTPTETPSSGGSTPSAQTSWTPVAIETTAAVIPSTGVQVHVSYIGGFKGTYGLPASLQTIQSSGDRVYQVENATGTIQATFEKRDSSTKHEILVEIYKDGKLLTKGSTSAGYGKVALEVDSKTGVAKTPVISSASGAVTTTAAAAQKTTAPAATATTKKT